MKRGSYSGERAAGWARSLLIVLSGLATAPLQALAAAPPEIRISPANQVPACVTPERLMAFLQSRNRNLDPRFKGIAAQYKKHGEAWRVRWDYAFYQMAIETNFLSYRRPDGRWGDVDPKQNNFAGIGTTGGGVPGDRFPDVTTGVLGQIQHLVAYSGEHLDSPVAPRTQLKQDDIILESQKLRRPVRFSDLARRWAVDPKYGASIEWVADAYRSEHCRGRDTAEVQLPQGQSTEVLPWSKPAPAPVPAVRPAAALKRTAASEAPVAAPAMTAAVRQPAISQAQQTAAPPANNPNAVRTVWVSSPRAEPSAEVNKPVLAAQAQPSGLGVKPSAAPASGSCLITNASYGGKKTLLIRSDVQGQTRYTALTVLDGFEKSMMETFIRTHAQGGELAGEFADRAAALVRARELCPSASNG